MQKSIITDPETKEPYPDPLSINYNKVNFNNFTVTVELNTAHLTKFWYFMYNYYGDVDKDDLVLILNGVPYLGLLEAGDKLELPAKEDLENMKLLKGV